MRLGDNGGAGVADVGHRDQRDIGDVVGELLCRESLGSNEYERRGGAGGFGDDGFHASEDLARDAHWSVNGDIDGVPEDRLADPR